MAPRIAAIAAAALLMTAPAVARAQIAGLLTNQPPDSIVYGYLMTDGTVLYQGGGIFDILKFTPDQNGSYLNGTWSQVASLPSNYGPYAGTGAVLADGRLLLEGGEYLVKGRKLPFTLTNEGAVYDPRVNSWTMVAPPAWFEFIGDSPSTVLADGKFLLGQKLTKRAAELDPATMTWRRAGTAGKADFNSEEGWTLLPDGTVLTVDVRDHPNSELYIPNADPPLGYWLSLGSTVADLTSQPLEGPITFDNGKRVYHPPGEVGPAILRPDGTVFATGALRKGQTNAHTAIYRPGRNGQPGSWAPGPDFLPGDTAEDWYAVLLPNGNVLVETSTASGEEREQRAVAFLSGRLEGKSAPAQAQQQPTFRLYEFDGTNLVLEPITLGSFLTPNLLVLPTGEVILGGFAMYEPTGTPAPDWAPVITHAPDAMRRGFTYTVSGRQFNGLSQASAFGDEFSTAENYPLARITNRATGHVSYARTHDHSSMGVATGRQIVSTHVDVSDAVEPGPSWLEVVANGIPSRPVNVDIR